MASGRSGWAYDRLCAPAVMTNDRKNVPVNSQINAVIWWDRQEDQTCEG
jgi:hypothetical protein